MEESKNIRSYNIGNSDYAEHKVQPWDIWIEYGLNPFDADIVKRILRRKKERGMTNRESRKLDYLKVIHICQERLNQLDSGIDPWNEFLDTIEDADFEDAEPQSTPAHSNGIIDGKYYRCKYTCFYGHFKAGQAYLAQNGYLLYDNSRAMLGKNALEHCFELVD